MAEKILMNEFKTLSKEKWVNISLKDDNVFMWHIALMVLNPDSLYYGGYFLARMKFPKNYPYSPPEFEFVRSLYHPNIYKDGKLCISILHPPGEDEMSGELAAERWSPIQRAETVLLSIISLLDDAECSSAANVDAAVMLRNKPEQYKKLVKRDVEASKKDIPDWFVVPNEHITTTQEPVEKHDDRDFWYDSDDGSDFDDDFGGSDTDAEMTQDDDQEEDDGEGGDSGDNDEQDN